MTPEKPARDAEALAQAWLEVQQRPVASWKYSTGVALTEISKALLIAVEALHDLCSCMTAQCNCRACAALSSIRGGSP